MLRRAKPPSGGLGVAQVENEAYDSEAVGGLGEPGHLPKLCKGGYGYDYWTCSACAEAKNYGEGITNRAKKQTASRPQVGASWCQRWYDTQAKTLASLRAEEKR